MNFIGKHFKTLLICMAITLASVNIFIRNEQVTDTVNVTTMVVAITFGLISKRYNRKNEDLNENDLT